MKESFKPLVSIIVPTYNSGETIIETLDSIKSQRYDYFEVIICDDASKDNTIQKCQSWIEKNQIISQRTQFLVSESNLGTCKNLNNAIRHAKGDWIKIIAGDDHLLPNCLEDNIKYITENPETELLFTHSRGFGNEAIAQKCKWVGDSSRFFEELSPKQFQIALLSNNFLSAPSAFIKMKVYKELDGFDESYKLIEDWPFWIKAMDYGKTMKYLKITTVEYRLNENSVSNNFNNPTFMKDRKKVGLMALDHMRKISFLANLYVSSLLRYQNNPNGFNRFVHSLNVLNPFYRKLKKVRKILDVNTV